MMPTRRRFLLLCLLCGLLACLPFLAGLPGGFVFDDIPNIVENTGIELQSLQPQAILDAAFSTQRGGYTRVLPTLTFALDYYRAGGFDPGTFKTTNILIHGLTAAFLMGFLADLFSFVRVERKRAQWAAMAIALAWALHPLQVSSVLYVVQRMQTLATLFLVLALWSYLRARQAQVAGESGRTGWMLAGLLWILAIACKEDAVLLPAYTLALELVFLRFGAKDPALARSLQRGYLLTATVGAIIFLSIVVPRCWSWGAYPGRNFSTVERLLTQGRALCTYLWQILIPFPSHMPFYYDWWLPSRGVLKPWTTLPSILFLAGLLGLAWKIRKVRPLFAFGIFLFFAGHFITSNVIPLELAFEHRNHLPLIGIVIAVGDLFYLITIRAHVRPVAVTAICIFSLVGLAKATELRARSWNSNLSTAMTNTQLAPMSPRAWNSLCVSWFELGGNAHAGNLFLDKAIAACEKEASVDPTSLVGMTNIIAFKTIQGSITSTDWDRYLDQLRRVPMTTANTGAIWIILNRARDGMPVDGNRMLEAIDTINRRRPYGTIESAALGYFILGHTQRPEKAYPYFVQAVSSAKDPSFAAGLADELRKEGRADWAARLEIQAAANRDNASR